MIMKVPNIDFSAMFRSQTDRELDSSIKELVETRCDRKDMSLTHIETLACNEWKRRHPGKLAPCIFERAKAKGGFPKCYDGPRETIEIDEDNIK